ncbi:MAG: enoyl-CoA hydratase-related protein [Thermoplasmata archaeon]|nr:enoyl-CoA hydratase-related protein [Thermoplasmata archaeon]
MGSSLVDRRSEGDGVELLTLRNPPLNLLSTAVMTGLAEAVDSLERSPSTRCVVLTGEGKNFCAGADLKEMATIGLAEAPKVVRHGHALFSRIAGLNAPVIGAIQGLALGGGLELALACDLRVAGESAKLGAPETSFGLMPAYGGTQRLPRLLGVSKAAEMIFTAGMIHAAEAWRIGLVNQVVPAGQELRAARDLAHTIGQRAPRAVQAAKRVMREGRERPLSAGLELEARAFEGEVLGSEDLREGLGSFAEHRPPRFTGK